MAAVFGRQNVEILFQNLGQRGARRRFVVDDEDGGSGVDRVLCERLCHTISCMMGTSFRQGNHEWLLQEKAAADALD